MVAMIVSDDLMEAAGAWGVHQIVRMTGWLCILVGLLVGLVDIL